MEGLFNDTSIKHYRRMANLKQFVLAGILGLTVTDMSFIENKKLYPSLDIAGKMADALHVTVGCLYSDSELGVMREREGEKV